MQIAILGFLLLGVPLLAGGVFGNACKSWDGVLFRWVSGQFLLWAGFELISVPMILMEESFTNLVRIFLLFTGCTILLALWLDIRRGRKGLWPLRGAADRNKKDPLGIGLWCLVAALLLVQLVLAWALAYEESDDAFYVSISTVTAEADTMYLRHPYTGGTTIFDMRHALAPFPIWISFLSRLSGMPAETVAQKALPMVLMDMSYGNYLLIGTRLFKRDSRKLPLFMVLLECLVLFGGYSLYSAENFLLVRTAQGKAVLANIVVPFLFLLFYTLMERLQDNKSVDAKHWLLTACAMVTGCLCSTQGTQVAGMLLGILGCCTAAAYRRWKLLLPMAGCAVIPGGLAALYFLLG